MRHEPEKKMLAEHLRHIVETRLLDPLEILLESDIAISSARRQVVSHANRWADELLSDDEQQAAHAIARLIAALYPGDAPFDPPVEWWGTPLGQVVARRIGHPFTEAVSYPVAGAMLGVTRQFVHNLVTRGRLERHPGGGVTVASVRARLTARPPGPFPAPDHTT